MENVHIKAKAVDLPIDRIVNSGNKPFIPFGKDNLFPQQIAKVSREAPNHRAIINSKTLYVSGKAFISEDQRLLDFFDAIKFRDTFKNIVLDYMIGGNAFYELVKDRRGNLLNIFHQDFTKVRVSKENDSVILHNNWQKFKETEAQKVGLYPYWSKGEDGMWHSVVHMKDYEPEFQYYGIPNWYAGLRAAQIAKKTNEFNDERLSNKFSIDGMLVIPGVSDVKDAEKIERKLQDYQGAENAGKIIAHYLQPLGVGEQRERAEFIRFNEQVDGLFIELHRQSDSDLIKVHSWYRSLCAFEENTGFDTQRIKNDYSIAMAAVIQPMQEFFMDSFLNVLPSFGYGEFSIYNENPVYVPSGVEFVWEVRKKLGLDYNENDPAQQMFYAEIGASSYLNIRERYLMQDPVRYKEKHYSANNGGQA